MAAVFNVNYFFRIHSPPLAQRVQTAQDKKITSETELIAELREQIKLLQAENTWLKERLVISDN